MELQLSCFRSWKMMFWKCCTQYASKIGKLSSGHRTGNCQLSFQSQRKVIGKAREFQKKTSISAFLTMPKPLTVWITTNCGKFWKRWEYQATWPASWEIYIQVRKQQLELDMEQQTGSFVKAVYCHPAYLTYMQSTSCEMPGRMKQKLESWLLGEISITSDTQKTPCLWQKAKRN